MTNFFTFIISTILVSSIYAVPPTMSKPVTVSGEVIDYYKSEGLLVLKEATTHTVDSRVSWIGTKGRVARWIANLDRKFVLLEIKKEDVTEIRKRKKITVTGYSWATHNPGFVLIDYKSITVK